MKLFSISIVTIGLLSTLTTQISVAEEKHSIDVAMEMAIEKDSSTAGQVKAISRALKDWDALLNESYQTLLKQLEPATLAALKKSQREWLAWRDLELKSLNAFYSKMEGTMYAPMRAHAAMNLTRRRAMSLENLVGLIEARNNP